MKQILKNVCPNCGGGFVSRPIRPTVARRNKISLEHHPASKRRVHTKYSKQEISSFVDEVKDIPVEDR